MIRRRPNVRVRTRIALTICALSTGLLVLMSVAVYLAFDAQLRASLDETLALRAEANLQFVDVAVSPPALVVRSDPGNELARGEAVLRLYGVDGHLLADGSSPTVAPPAEQPLIAAAIAERSDVYRSLELEENEEYRVVGTPIMVGGEVAAVLLTGIERSRIDNPLTLLRLILLIAVPVTAVALGLGGYWIARRALRPVAAMTEAARRITRGDLHQRIEGAPSDDELGQLAATLNSMIARLGETVERERRFTADASHELRTPLAAIETGIDVTLGQERDAAEYRRVLAVVRKQTRRLHTLANQLLLLSRLDDEDMRRGFDPVELTGLVEAVVESFRANHPRSDVRLSGTPGPLDVLGDFELLARAYVNLLENAVAHVGPAVRLSVGLYRSGRGTLIVAIEDDGPGVPGALAPEVFQRFRRGDASREGGGTGLGLAIVAAIARVHGGTARLVPGHEGRGARFEVELPEARN